MKGGEGERVEERGVMEDGEQGKMVGGGEGHMKIGNGTL